MDQIIFNQNKQENGLIGVKGWLLFFVIILTILTPLQFISNFIDGFREHILSDSPLKTPQLFIFSTIIQFLIASLSLYTGIALWKIKPYALMAIKTYLFAMIALNTVVMLIYMNIVIATMFLVVLAWLSAWFFYFKKSHRVKATYGANI